MKIALLGDTHLDFKPSFIPYFSKFYEEIMFPYLEEHNIRSIFQFGDLFDNRRKVDSYCLSKARQYFFSQFSPMHDKFWLDTFLGNHDIYYRNTLSVNTPSQVIDPTLNITIHDKPCEIGNILLIPWICEENEEQVFDAILKTKCKYLFGHLELAGFEMNKGYVMEHGMDHKLFSKFERVFSGHYHCQSSKDNITYIGTPYELTFNDCNDLKGFHIFDTETGEIEFIQNPYKMFHRIRYNDGYNYDLTSIEGCMVQVIVENKSDQMRYDLFVKEIEQISVMSLKFIDNFEEFGEVVIDVDNIDISDTISLLNKYVDESGHKDADEIKKILQELHHDALEMTGE